MNKNNKSSHKKKQKKDMVLFSYPLRDSRPTAWGKDVYEKIREGCRPDGWESCKTNPYFCDSYFFV